MPLTESRPMRLAPHALSVPAGDTARVTVTVSPQDIAKSGYLYLQLDLPPGLTRLEITQAYDKTPDCLIDLGLFDPRATGFPTRTGFRGWSGGARSSVFVALDDATPGYVPGPLMPGRWLVILGLVRLPEGDTEVTITARGTTADRPPAQPAPEGLDLSADGRPVRPGPIWARGDCQCHTFHSDAQGAPEVLAAQARKAGLDFLFVTDHNTLSAWNAYFARASTPDLLFLRGLEVTTPPGHGNALGIERWVDFRLEAPGDADVLVAEVAAAGGVFSINHDKPDIPWDWPVPAIGAMEVWQRHWLMANDVARRRYDARLARGRRIALIGGSDWHQPATVSDDPFALGCPTTVLHCADLSHAGVMAALRAGHGYVTEGPDGPSLITTVDGAPMGAVLARPGTQLEAETSGAEGDDLVLIAEGAEVGRATIPSGGRLTLPLPQGLRHVRAEIEARASRPRLIAAFRDWLDSHQTPRGDLPPPHAIPRLLRAMGNPHYFGNWT